MKLFEYPELVIDHILKSMCPVSLISLSFCSKKTEKRIKKCAFRLPDASFRTKSELFDGPLISFTFPFYNYTLGIQFRAPIREYLKKVKKFDGVVGGHTYHFKYIDDHVFLGSLSHRLQFLFVNHLLTLFRVKLTTIVGDLNKIPNIKQFFDEQCFSHIAHVSLQGNIISSSKLKDFSDTLSRNLSRPLSRLKILPFVNRRLHSDSDLFLHSDYLEIMNAQCLTKEHLFRIDSAFCFLDKTPYNTDNMIDLVRNWLNGNHSKTTMFCVHSETPLDMERIHETFDTKPWDPTKRGAKFVTRQSHSKNRVTVYELEKCRDLERGDGMIATISCWTNTCFMFYVWHDPFPVVPLQGYTSYRGC